MPTKDLSEAQAGYEGLNFGSMLREYLASGMIAVDAAEKIIALTPEAERTLGLASIKGRCFGTLPESVKSVIREARTTGHAVVERRIMLQPDSAGTSLSITAMPVSAGNDSISVFAMLRDVSSGRKLEHNLRRLDRLASMGTLSASMAHEIKNALVPVRTLVDLLLEKKSENELAGTVRRELARVESIVSHMLRFAPPAHPTFSPIRLHELLEHSLRLAQHRIGNKVIAIHREFHASPDSFNGDDHQLEQAFVNLMLNAVEAIGPEGRLTISTDLVNADAPAQLREGGAKALRVGIADTGTGISPEHLGRIFEPFFTTKHHGTGLGLPVTRRIIAEHGGSIEIDSSPGAGTTFTIHLPVAGKSGSS